MAMKQINNIFQIIETKFMLDASDNDLAVALDNLIQIYDEFDKEQVFQEIKPYRRHVLATDTTVDVAARWTAQEIL